MNKKINPLLAVALIIIMAGVSVVVIWRYSAKLKESVPAAQQAGQVSNFKPAVMAEQPPTDNQATATANNEAEPLQNHSDSSTIEYINNEFGFKLNLPAKWKGYKAITFKRTTLPAAGGQEFTSVQILLPTTEPDWEGAGNGYDTIVKGYAAVLDVDIFDINIWNEGFNSTACDQNPKECPSLDGLLIKTDKYMYFASGLDNGLPYDLRQVFSSYWPSFDPKIYVEQNFTLIDN